MVDSVVYGFVLWFIVAILAILTGKYLAYRFGPKQDEHYLRQGICSDCGSKSLRRSPIDEQSVQIDCPDCGSAWLVLFDSDKPIERLQQQRAHFPQLRFHIDRDRPAFIFETDLVRAAFPLDVFQDMPFYGAATPREMLQVVHDMRLEPIDLHVDLSLIDDTRFSHPWTPADTLTAFFEHVGVVTDKDEDHA